MGEEVAAVKAAPADPQARMREQIARAIVVAVLCIAPALICLHMAVITDPDVWWQLRTGEWISQHHGFPHADPFSSATAGKPWAAYSWLFDLLIFWLYKHAGLVGIMIYSTAIVAAITGALYHLLHRHQPDFFITVIVTCAAWWAMMPIYTPRPWLITILLYVIELDILLYARKTGNLRGLLWLPPLFALWANVHIQFMDGLLVLGLALAETALAQWWGRAEDWFATLVDCADFRRLSGGADDQPVRLADLCHCPRTRRAVGSARQNHRVTGAAFPSHGQLPGPRIGCCGRVLTRMDSTPSLLRDIFVGVCGGIFVPFPTRYVGHCGVSECHPCGQHRHPRESAGPCASFCADIDRGGRRAVLVSRVPCDARGQCAAGAGPRKRSPARRGEGSAGERLFGAAVQQLRLGWIFDLVSPYAGRHRWPCRICTAQIASYTSRPRGTESQIGSKTRNCDPPAS